MQHLSLVQTAPMQQPRHNGFSSRDRIALTCWMQRTDVHGYRRVVIEGGSHCGGPEDAGYVLIYAPNLDWASWGMACANDGIVVWHCGTGADLGHFPTMREALDSLPPRFPASIPRHTAGTIPKLSATPVRLHLVHSA